jgi:opacity protein-like surface antigen
MKKILLSVAAVFAFGIASAQDGMSFGAKAGFTSLSQKIDIDGLGSGTESESGFFVGMFAEFGVSESLTFKPEVLYVSVEDLGQIQIPLHLRYNIAEGFGLMAGPNVAFLMDVPDGYKSLNYGIDLGASYNITEALLVDARYNIGLANISDVDGVDSKLSGFYVGLGYRF